MTAGRGRAVAARAMAAARTGAALIACLLFATAPAATPGGFRTVRAGEPISYYALSDADGDSPAPVPRGVDLDALDASGSAAAERISGGLGLSEPGPLKVFLVPVRRAVRRDAPVPALPDWAAGAAFGAGGDIVLIVGRPGSYPDRSLEGVLAHEIAHVLLDRLVEPAGGRVPRWFDEGFAVLEARPWSWRDALEFATTIIPARLPPLAHLDAGFPAGEGDARAAYAVSVSFVAFLEKRWGPGAARAIARQVGRGVPFRRAVEHVTGEALFELERQWRREASVWFRWIPLATSSAMIWSIILLLGLLAGAKRRARRRRIEQTWEREGLGDDPTDPYHIN